MLVKDGLFKLTCPGGYNGTDIPASVVKAGERASPFWVSQFGNIARGADTAEAESETQRGPPSGEHIDVY